MVRSGTASRQMVSQLIRLAFPFIQALFLERVRWCLVESVLVKVAVFLFFLLQRVDENLKQLQSCDISIFNIPGVIPESRFC